LQTKSNIFLKKSQKLAILSDFFTKISDFGAKSSLFIGVCTLFNYHCFCFVALSGPPIPYLYIIIIGCLIYFACKVTTIFGKNKYFCDFLSKLSRLWRSGERNDITDILHTCDEKDEPFETQSETGMGA
jgi:uncharacterized membrane protein YoaT (DUF817 family)